MIDAEFVQAIIENAKTQQFELPAELSKDGAKHLFTTEKLEEIVAATSPLLSTVAVTTLQGLADTIGQSIDGLDKQVWFLHVEAPGKVTLKSKITDKWGRRDVLIEAKPVEFAQFQFGQWLVQEDFMIQLASRFSPTDDREYVIGVAGNLTADASDQREDDGFTQKAIVKQGMKPKETVTLKPRVDLAPFRYFPECNQVVSPFVFRARQTENGPTLALFEADGGRWKIGAIAEVARFLRVLNTGIEVVA